jgi:NTE family protein
MAQIKNLSLEESLKNDLSILLNETTNNSHNNKLSFFINRKKLVLSGGGLKGIALIGAIKALKDLGCLNIIDTIVGSSVGALIGILLTVGYSPEDLYDFMMAFNIGVLGNFNFNNLTHFGLDDGNKVTITIKTLLKSKGFDDNITFIELYEKTKIKYIITATCVNTKNIIYYSYETYPQMNVITAVRMSISIPLYFTPVLYEGKLFIDGGCIDNYPIQLLKNDINDVIGIYLSDIREVVENINNIEDYIMGVIDTLFEGVAHNSLKGYEQCTIRLNVSRVTMANLNMDMDKKQELLNFGYNTIMETLK